MQRRQKDTCVAADRMPKLSLLLLLLPGARRQRLPAGPVLEGLHQQQDGWLRRQRRKQGTVRGCQASKLGAAADQSIVVLFGETKGYYSIVLCRVGAADRRVHIAYCVMRVHHISNTPLLDPP